MSQDTEASCSVFPQSMGVWLLVAEGGRARDHSMTWASTQCRCSQYDTPEMCPVTQACSGPSQTTRPQALPAWGEFNLAAPWRVDSGSPAASQSHFPSSLLSSATPPSLFQKNDEAASTVAPLGVSGHLPSRFLTAWLTHHLPRFQLSGPRQCC